VQPGLAVIQISVLTHDENVTNRAFRTLVECSAEDRVHDENQCILLCRYNDTKGSVVEIEAQANVPSVGVENDDTSIHG